MFLERDNHKIYYEIHGEGDPLLFVHGWMMNTTVWRKQIHYFAKSHQVIAFDLTGYGQSDKPEIKYCPDVWMADIDAVIAHCNLHKPVFIGWSMGGSLGIAYAATKPDALALLALVDSTPLLVASPEEFQHATLPGEAEQLLGAIQTDFSNGARGFVEMMLPENGIDDIKGEFYDATQQTTSTIALESIMSAGTADLRPLLANITVPTVVLHGDEDKVCKPGAGKYLASNIANARLHTFPGKGHAPFMTDAENFNSILASFLPNFDAPRHTKGEWK